MKKHLCVSELDQHSAHSEKISRNSWQIVGTIRRYVNTKCVERKERETKRTEQENLPPLLLNPLIGFHEIPKLLRSLRSDYARIDVRPTSQIIEDTG
jgi:hypothetical protein